MDDPQECEHEHGIFLPDEVIIRILTSIPSEESHAQSTYAACTRLSWQWYACATPFLYESPRLQGPKFAPFMATICPSINLHVRRSRLAGLVKVLDLGALVHQSSRSMTARLLGRVKGSLVKFRAPQASFAVNCLPALSKCTELTHLDLSLVSGSPPLPELFRSLSGLSHLKTLYLPRCSGFGSAYGTASRSSATPAVNWSWPPNLNKLALSGGIDMHFVRGKINLPDTLTDLSIEHIPTAGRQTVRLLLEHAVIPLPNLKKLRIAHMPRLVGADLDNVLDMPQLEVLSIGAEYITDLAFGLNPPDSDIEESGIRRSSARRLAGVSPHKHLHTLELTNTSGSNAEDLAEEFSPLDVLEAIEEGLLPALRRIRVVKSLGWGSAGVFEQYAEGIAGALAEQARTQGDETETGVWVFEDHLVR